METYDAIISRRSVRSFEDRPIPDDLLELMLKAAMSGPSASNQRPWQFMVLTEKERLKALSRVRGYECVAGAGAAIIVCGDQERNRLGEVWVMDGSVAAQNILLTAHENGLGGVWLGCYPAPERLPTTCQVLGLPWQIVPLGVLAIGYPAKPVSGGERYEPERVHRNRW